MGVLRELEFLLIMASKIFVGRRHLILGKQVSGFLDFVFGDDSFYHLKVIPMDQMNHVLPVKEQSSKTTVIWLSTIFALLLFVVVVVLVKKYCKFNHDLCQRSNCQSEDIEMNDMGSEIYHGSLY